MDKFLFKNDAGEYTFFMFEHLQKDCILYELYN